MLQGTHGAHGAAAKALSRGWNVRRGSCLIRPVQPEEEARMRELLTDLHDNFKATVRTARGAKLDTSNEEELWSGRAWTGRQAAKLGLVDGVGTLQETMRAKFGDQVKRTHA